MTDIHTTIDTTRSGHTWILAELLDLDLSNADKALHIHAKGLGAELVSLARQQQECIAGLETELVVWRKRTNHPGDPLHAMAEYCKGLEEEVAECREALDRLKIWAATCCDQPEDRMYHAADDTWWRREGDRWRSADPPEMIALACRKACREAYLACWNAHHEFIWQAEAEIERRWPEERG